MRSRENYKFQIMPSSLPPLPCMQLFLFRLLPARLLSRTWGRTMSLELPLWLRRPVLGLYVWTFGCKMEEAVVEGLEGYGSLMELFTRELKEGARTVSCEHSLVSTLVASITQHTKHTHTHTYMYTHSLSHTRTCTLTHSRTHVHVHSLTLAHMYMYTHSHTQTHMYTHTHTYIHIIMHTHTCTHTHMHTYLHSHTHIHMYTHSLSLSHTHTHTHTLTHTHAKVCPSDGTVLHFGRVQNGRVEQVKGVTYSLDKFLGPGPLQHQTVDTPQPPPPQQQRLGTNKNAGSPRPSPNRELYHIVIYLAPGGYHHFHSPADWKAQQRRHFPGN